MHTTVKLVQRDVSSQQCFLNIKTVLQIQAKNVGSVRQVGMALSATHADIGRGPTFQNTGLSWWPSTERDAKPGGHGRLAGSAWSGTWCHTGRKAPSRRGCREKPRRLSGCVVLLASCEGPAREALERWTGSGAHGKVCAPVETQSPWASLIAIFQAPAQCHRLRWWMPGWRPQHCPGS